MPVNRPNKKNHPVVSSETSESDGTDLVKNLNVHFYYFM